VQPTTETDPEQEMATLSRMAADCTACPLAHGRRNVVFGTGKVVTPLMLIGEGPGETEDAQGLPFVGRAGQLLDQAMRDAGILRKHLYIANIVKCRATLVENGRVLNRPPTPEETEVCIPLWLEKQIAIIKPAVILSIGSPSANAMIHKGFKITQERGKWFETKYTRYAMATLHPAYILRMTGESYDLNYRLLVSDIAAAKDKAREAKNEPRLSLF